MPVTKRPRSPCTVLIRALVTKQDAMARRTARKINTLLAEYIPLEAMAFSWANVRRLTHEKFGPSFLDRLVDGVAPADPEQFRTECGRLVAEALAELDRADTMFGPAPATRPPEEPRAVVHRSRTLAEARAQHAQLQSRLMDFQARIVPLRALQEPL